MTSHILVDRYAPIRRAEEKVERAKAKLFRARVELRDAEAELARVKAAADQQEGA